MLNFFFHFGVLMESLTTYLPGDLYAICGMQLECVECVGLKVQIC